MISNSVRILELLRPETPSSTENLIVRDISASCCIKAYQSSCLLNRQTLQEIQSDGTAQSVTPPACHCIAFLKHYPAYHALTGLSPAFVYFLHTLTDPNISRLFHLQ